MRAVKSWRRRGAWANAGAAPSRRRRRFAIAAVLVVLAYAALEAYSRWPSGADIPALGLRPATRELALVVHGSFGREEPVIVGLTGALTGMAHASGRDDLEVLQLDWSPASDNILRAGPNAERIGRELGAQLARLGGVTRLRLVAHSAGAYMLDPLCEAWREGRRAAGAELPADAVRMVFLDPIGLRGLLERGWGAANFGRCADQAEAYVNVDDPAPATDRVLRHARTLDVTDAGHAANFDGGGHRWPVEYYRRLLLGRGWPPPDLPAAARLPAALPAAPASASASPATKLGPQRR